MKRSASNVSTRNIEDQENRLTTIAEANKTAEKKSSSKKLHAHNISLLALGKVSGHKRTATRTPEVGDRLTSESRPKFPGLEHELPRHWHWPTSLAADI
jgi:hypothetical protein